MMLNAIKPHGLIISDQMIKYRLEEYEKFYVIDKGYNKIEISKEDYMRLKAPIRKKANPNDIQGIKNWDEI